MPDSSLQPPNSSYVINREGRYLIVTGVGHISSVVFASGEKQNLNIYDGVNARGTLIASFEAVSYIGSISLNTIFKIGLFVETLTTFNSTIVYYSVLHPPLP